MHLQLWSSNYDPEPQGIAPLSAMLARELQARGHQISVVAAHPHYPEPAWGNRVLPYREVRDGISVLRLPLWIGRDSGLSRIRQELSFTAVHAAFAPFVGRPDAIIAVSPSFPALGVAMAAAKARRIPWVMWLQDIVTDGAATTGELSDSGPVLRCARRFEIAAYRSASKVVAISDAFRDNLVGKGVEAEHVVRIFNPTSRTADAPNDIDDLVNHTPTILAMGNIGHTQGLDRIVEAFESSNELAAISAELLIAGSGVAADDVRGKITTDRVSMPGVLYGEELMPALRGASIGLVSQRGDILEFNLPSKLMNYMTHGVPVIASVNPASETARIVHESGAGWVTDASNPSEFAARAAKIIRDRDALRTASRRGFDFARSHFAPATVAERFEDVLNDVLGDARPPFEPHLPVSTSSQPVV